jgi:hypothetical protein
MPPTWRGPRPPLGVRAYAHLAVRAPPTRPRPPARAPCPCAPPSPCVPPLPCTPPSLCACPLAVCTPLAARAPGAVHAPFPCAPPWPCAPLFTVRAPRARLSHPSAPLPCAPPEYKSHKLIVHSTTWASGPLTTERWLTTGCLGGDHSFYIHSHSHALGCACMHVTFHVFLFIFIVNACQLGGHIKLLVSLYTF